MSPEVLARLWPRVAESLGLTVEGIELEEQLATLIAPGPPGGNEELTPRYLVRFTPAFQAGVTVVALTLNDPAALAGSEKLENAGRDFFVHLEQVMSAESIDFSPPPAEVRLQEDRRRRVLAWLAGIFVVVVAVTALSFMGFFSGGQRPELAPANAVNALTGLPDPNYGREPASMSESLPPPPPQPKDPSEATGTVVTLETTQGDIVVELFDEATPITAGNFLLLVKSGFYNGLSFHRVEPNFVIQGGDPQGTGGGGPGYTIPDELNSHLKHDRGMLSMAKTAEPNTAGSQFFIVTGGPETVQHLDGQHAVFGRVLEGMDVVDKIEVGDRMKRVIVVEESKQAPKAMDEAKRARVPDLG